MLEVGSLEWNKRSIVIPGIVGFPASLFDHDPFGITSAAADLRIDIILSIATGGKASFSVLEVTPADIAWKWLASSLFQQPEQIVGFLRRCGRPRGLVGLWREKNRGAFEETVLVKGVRRDADRGKK